MLRSSSSVLAALVTTALLGCASGRAHRDAAVAPATVYVPAELVGTCALEPPEHFEFDRSHRHRGCIAELSDGNAAVEDTSPD